MELFFVNGKLKSPNFTLFYIIVDAFSDLISNVKIAASEELIKAESFLLIV